MADTDKVDLVERERDVYMQVAIAGHVFVAIMRFPERVWLLSKERLENMPDYNSQLRECRHGVMLA